MLTKRKLITLLGALIVLIAAAGLVAYYKKESQASPQNAPPAIPVTAVAVSSRTMPVRLYAIGNVEPFTTVALKARVDGQIVSVHFKEGDEVKQGAVLFEIDPRPFAAMLQQAQANLLKDRALLDRATDQEKRYKNLLAKYFISPDAYDQVRTNQATAADRKSVVEGKRVAWGGG